MTLNIEKFYIYYRPDDGEIMGWGNGHDPDPIGGLSFAFVDFFNPDPSTQKFDGDGVVLKTTEERYKAGLPTPRDIAVMVFVELRRTDPFMLPDYPIDDNAFDGWKAYRKALRDLSKGRNNPADMINAWPLPPDGADPITALRERL